MGFLWRALMLPTNGLTMKDLDNFKIKHFPSLAVENEWRCEGDMQKHNYINPCEV
jgi:hypothetical protein